MSKNLPFGIVMLIISSLHLVFNLNNRLDFSIFVSLIGIAGFLLQLKGVNVYKSLQLIWIIAQFPIISVSEDFRGILHETIIFDLSQLYGYSIKFGLLYSPKWYHIGINLIPVFYLILFKLNLKKEYLNQQVRVIIDSRNSNVSSLSPLVGKIIEFKKDWYTAKLDSNIEIDRSEFDLVKFKLKKVGFFKPEKERQFCEIRISSSVHGHELFESGFVK